MKDLRLVESEEGKWTMGTWQSMNESEVSVEREDRVAVERVRSEEQLVRRRVMRWRNGVAVSQVVALWKEGRVHGLWVVAGM